MTDKQYVINYLIDYKANSMKFSNNLLLHYIFSIYVFSIDISVLYYIH